MSKTLRLAAAISLASTPGLAIPARAQHEPTKRPPVQGQNHSPGPPGQHLPGPAGRPGPMTQALHSPGPGPRGGPPGPHAIHALGERGYSFRGPGGARRDIATFSPREREFWLGGRWHHEMRFGRLGYWWEVNGAWYFYDRPFEGAPAFVSAVELMDDGLGLGPRCSGCCGRCTRPRSGRTGTSSRCGTATGRRRTSTAPAGRMRRPALRAVSVFRTRMDCRDREMMGRHLPPHASRIWLAVGWEALCADCQSD